MYRQPEHMPDSERGGLADVVYVLCLMQAAFLVLAGLGEVLMMGGNGAYLIAPVVKGAVLLWLGAKVVRYRKWALITLIVLQALTLVALPIQMLVSLAPTVDFAPSLVELLTTVVMPGALIAMCALLLARRREVFLRETPATAPVTPAPALPQPAPTYEWALVTDPYEVSR
jgi:LytS/YehU family sensor histidine kinase